MVWKGLLHSPSIPSTAAPLQVSLYAKEEINWQPQHPGFLARNHPWNHVCSLPHGLCEVIEKRCLFLTMSRVFSPSLLSNHTLPHALGIGEGSLDDQIVTFLG